MYTWAVKYATLFELRATRRQARADASEVRQYSVLMNMVDVGV